MTKFKSMSYTEMTQSSANKNNRAINSDLGFVPGEIIGVSGDSGSGKSIWLQNLVLSIMLDKPYLTQEGNDIDDDYSRDAIQHKVLWIDTDGFGEVKFLESISKFFSDQTDPNHKTPFSIRDSKILHNINYMKSGSIIDDKKVINFILSLNDKDSTVETKNSIIEECKRTQSTIIVVDSLRSVTDEDENDSKMALIIQMLKEIAERTNTILFFIHHSSEKSMSKYRGSTSIKDKLAEFYHISHEQRSDIREITVENIKSRSGNCGYKWIYESKMFNFVIPEKSRSLIKRPSKPLNYDFGLVQYKTLSKCYDLNKYTGEVLSEASNSSTVVLSDLVADVKSLYNFLVETEFDSSKKITASAIVDHLKKNNVAVASGLVTKDISSKINEIYESNK